jgi:hypothetical protein
MIKSSSETEELTESTMMSFFLRIHSIPVSGCDVTELNLRPLLLRKQFQWLPEVGKDRKLNFLIQRLLP